MRVYMHLIPERDYSFSDCQNATTNNELFYPMDPDTSSDTYNNNNSLCQLLISFSLTV